MFTCTVTLTPVLVHFVNNSLTILHHVIVYCGYLAEINFCPAGSSGHITVFQREAPTQTYNFRHDSSVVILKRCLEGAGLVPAPCGSSGSDSPYKGPAGKSSWEWRQNAGFFCSFRLVNCYCSSAEPVLTVLRVFGRLRLLAFKNCPDTKL